MSYADYNFYTEVYGGSSLPSASSKKYLNRASYFIDKITFNRLKGTEVDESVKMAVCSVAEKMYEIDSEGGIKTSETVKSYSVSYANNKTADMEYIDCARMYLAQELLYRGIR